MGSPFHIWFKHRLVNMKYIDVVSFTKYLDRLRLNAGYGWAFSSRSMFLHALQRRPSRMEPSQRMKRRWIPRSVPAVPCLSTFFKLRYEFLRCFTFQVFLHGILPEGPCSTELFSLWLLRGWSSSKAWRYPLTTRACLNDGLSFQGLFPLAWQNSRPEPVDRLRGLPAASIKHFVFSFDSSSRLFTQTSDVNINVMASVTSTIVFQLMLPDPVVQLPDKPNSQSSDLPSLRHSLWTPDVSVRWLIFRTMLVSWLVMSSGSPKERPGVRACGQFYNDIHCDFAFAEAQISMRYFFYGKCWPVAFNSGSRCCQQWVVVAVRH